tara:strand:- start:35029 stop:36633 length:1605 start_codon:yes stop_codon:yes gene_type:complete
MALLDHNGRPMRPSAATLTTPMAAPTTDSLHSVWSETVLAGLNPSGLANILKQAANGYPDRFLVLAEEMEERDLHYASVLSTRKLAITGVEPIVVPASKDAKDQAIAEAVKEIVQHPVFVDDYMADLLDALGKGYSVVETGWDRSGKSWHPARFEWRDPRHFVIDRVDGRTLRYKTAGKIEGEDLPPYLFSIHAPKRKSGLPIRGGLARMAAWAFLFKSYTLKDWMAFLEVYGMPLRVGKYGRGSSEDDRRVLLKAVRDLSSDAAAIIPAEMTIDFIEAGGGTGNAVFSSKAEYLDRQISKGILGQTMTADDGASLSQAKVHENVRHDIARADARQIAVTINRDLVRPYVDLNWGPQDHYPTVIIPITESDDIKVLAEVVTAAVALGVQIDANEFRERIGFGAPDDDAPVLRSSAKVPDAAKDKKAPAPANDDQPSEEKATASLCPHCGGLHSLAAEQRDDLDRLVEDALSHWESDMSALVKPVRELFARAGSYDAFVAGLEDMVAKVDAGPIADRLGKLMMKARGLGDLGEGE